MLATIQRELLELIRQAKSYRQLLELAEQKPELREALRPDKLPTEDLGGLWWLGKHASW